jgi:hypothetical protein
LIQPANPPGTRRVDLRAKSVRTASREQRHNSCILHSDFIIDSGFGFRHFQMIIISLPIGLDTSAPHRLPPSLDSKNPCLSIPPLRFSCSIKRKPPWPRRQSRTSKSKAKKC